MKSLVSELGLKYETSWKELSYVLSKNVVARVLVRFYFFSILPIFTVHCQHFSFSHRRCEMFLFFLQRNSLSFALSGSSSSSNSFSVSEDIKICLKRRLVCVIVFSLYMSSWLCDLLLKYPQVAFGLPYNISWLSYFILVCLWWGRVGHMTTKMFAMHR